MKDLKKMMTTSISEVLETMFFMALEFDEYITIEESGILSEESLRACKLTFRGPFSGHFSIFVPENILINMAVDFMGEEKENITREHSDGIIKEVINMVAGNMFAALDNQAGFDLGIPEIIDSDALKSEMRTSQPKYLVLAESVDGYLGVALKTVP